MTLSGASIGYNIEVSQALWKLRNGESKEDVIPSFDRYDYSPAAVREGRSARAQVIDAQYPPHREARRNFRGGRGRWRSRGIRSRHDRRLREKHRYSIHDAGTGVAQSRQSTCAAHAHRMV